MNIAHYEKELVILMGKIQGVELSSVRDPKPMAQKLHDLRQEVEDLMEKAENDLDISVGGSNGVGMAILKAIIQPRTLHSPAENPSNLGTE